MSWHPVEGNLMTRWAKEVSPENAWPEYPRPQMVRENWLNLNGLWEYNVTARGRNTIDGLSPDGQILAPFPIESALSGVKRPLEPDEKLWYRCKFDIAEAWQGKRVLLHFGAVDWECKVFVNGKQVGEHVGGYLPFWFDITEVLMENDRSKNGKTDIREAKQCKNELVVSVWDPTDTHGQQRGKQALKPKSIWYSRVSGIWQTVWLEAVPQTFIAGLKITPDLDEGKIGVGVLLDGVKRNACPIRISVYDGEELITEKNAEIAQEHIRIAIPHAHPWSPDSPHIYDLVVEAGEDRVESYFGMRKFSLGKDGKGRTRLCLNNQPLFQFGPLDQGFWPDGLYTPPTDEAMRWDLELVKRLGFNMLRKHVKVEPARYYYYCDKMGIIVWQDMVNGGREVGEIPTFLALTFGSRRRDRNYRYAGRQNPALRKDYRRELREMVDHLYNFPCIGVWVPFNEGWGQFNANQVTGWLKDYDPTRLVDQASGFFDQGGGDFKSLHVYFKKLPVTEPEEKRAVALSEFGGYSLKIDGHLWNPTAEFGYRKYPTPEDLTEAYLDLLESQVKPWIEAGLSAAIYTQTTDVEIEANGYVTYDREVEKMDFGRVREKHHDLMGSK